jgi:DUF1680 family protein
METVLYNTILGARPIRPDGVSFYYSDYNMNAVKSDYEQKWPCCSGTFPQLAADYGISSYLRNPKGLYVNLYVPSRVTWRQGNARVTLTQETQYPTVGETALKLTMDRRERFVIALRVPAWAGKGTRVAVNGKASDVAITAGRWAEIDRTWKDGDRVELSLDMPLRLVPLDARHSSLVALARGPITLFAVDPGSSAMTQKQMLAAQQVSANSADWAVQADNGRIVMRPFSEITTERYRLYQQT